MAQKTELTDEELTQLLIEREVDVHEMPYTSANDVIGSEWAPVEFDPDEFVELVFGLMGQVMHRGDVPADVRRLVGYLHEEAGKGVLHYTMH